MLTAPISKEIQRIRRIAIGDYVHRTARIHGERIAVVDCAIRMSYCELDEASNRFAHYLLALKPQGVQVGMLCANSAEMIVAINGIHKSGNVWLPVNAMLDGPQIKYILQHAEASVLVVDEALAQQTHIATVIGELGLPVVITRPNRNDSTSGITLSAAMSGQPSTLPEVEILPEPRTLPKQSGPAPQAQSQVPQIQSPIPVHGAPTAIIIDPDKKGSTSSAAAPVTPTDQAVDPLTPAEPKKEKRGIWKFFQRGQ